LIKERSILTCSRTIVLAILTAGLIGTPAIAATQQPAPTADWSAWQFLMGAWVGEGDGAPGQGQGGFTFAFDLQKRVLVRKNFASYPATKDRPAFTHDDLMVVYQEAGKPAQAIYFDNEGHVIHYSIEFSKDGDSVIFLGDPSPSAPRFRLTYVKSGSDALGIKFEIAPPGKPDAFAPYINARVHRK